MVEHLVEMLLLIQQTNPMQRQHLMTAVMKSRRNRTVTMQMEMVVPQAEIREKRLPCWI